MSAQDVTTFYDAMAPDYHLIYADWQQSVERQAVILDKLIQNYVSRPHGEIRVLDCACGIGTQALGLTKHGYRVHATDVSSTEVERAKQEAERMGIELTFGVADMLSLSQQVERPFDVVLAFDNALPHLLTDKALQQAARELFNVTEAGGIFMASIRDYDALLKERPQITSERFIQAQDAKRITFQLWEWDGDIYVVTQFILVHEDEDWVTRHYTTRYRALKRETLSEALFTAGFRDISWLMPDTSGFYQPVVIAQR